MKAKIISFKEIMKNKNCSLSPKDYIKETKSSIKKIKELKNLKKN